MRILELIKTQQTSTPISQREIDDLEQVDLYKPERGAFAVGKPTDDPHIFRKQTVDPTNINNDPTYLYIRAIEPFIDSNPYFPKTYVLDLRKDAQGAIRPAYDVETLIHGTNYSETAPVPIQDQGYTKESIYWMAARMYGNEDWIKAAPTTFTLPNKEDPKKDAQYVWEKAARLFRLLFKEYPTLDTAKQYNLKLDPKLLQSMDLIKRLMAKHPDFQDDLHVNNLMIRRTNLGPQMVINDPLSPGGTYSPNFTT